MFSSIFNLNDYSFTLFEKKYTIDTALLNLIKKVYIISVIFLWSFISSNIFNQLKTSPIFSLSDEESNNTTLNNPNELSLTLGTDTQTNQPVFIPEKGLYQNILITGTIGTGKTSSAMYPLVDQLLSKNIGMLILDVKGNFYFKVQEMAKRYGRKVTVIELNGKEKYNPLDKPHLKPSVIANRIRTILVLFSNQHVTDTYWMDKVELYLTECIKLCRMYNDNYVTFVELHKLIYDKTYLKEKIEYIKDLFISQKLNYTQVYEFKTCIEFFQSEYQGLDQKVLSIIQSEISRITQIFINDLSLESKA